MSLSREIPWKTSSATTDQQVQVLAGADQDSSLFAEWHRPADLDWIATIAQAGCFDVEERGHA
jgi:hypothetical protein